MVRKSRDYDAELQALMERARKFKSQKTTRLGELVQVTGADTLPIEALAGVLLATVEQPRKQPEAVTRWTECGEALFRTGKRDGSKFGSIGDAAGGTPAGPGTPAASGGA